MSKEIDIITPDLYTMGQYIKETFMTLTEIQLISSHLLLTLAIAVGGFSLGYTIVSVITGDGRWLKGFRIDESYSGSYVQCLVMVAVPIVTLTKIFPVPLSYDHSSLSLNAMFAVVLLAIEVCVAAYLLYKPDKLKN